MVPFSNFWLNFCNIRRELPVLSDWHTLLPLDRGENWNKILGKFKILKILWEYAPVCTTKLQNLKPTGCSKVLYKSQNIFIENLSAPTEEKYHELYIRLFCPLNILWDIIFQNPDCINAKIRSIILLANLLKGFVQICNLIISIVNNLISLK